MSDVVAEQYAKLLNKTPRNTGASATSAPAPANRDGTLTITHPVLVESATPVIRPALSGAAWTRLIANNAELDKSGIDPFPGQGSVGLYTKHLTGYPFVFVSDPIWRTQDGTYGPQEVAQVYVRFGTEEDGTTGDAVLATLTGRYLLNQLRAMTPNEQAVCVWTVRPHPTLRTIGNKPPLMLARYNADVDHAPEDTF